MSPKCYSTYGTTFWKQGINMGTTKPDFGSEMIHAVNVGHFPKETKYIVIGYFLKYCQFTPYPL